jgi:DNA-binding SARP family transcriptional activator
MDDARTGLHLQLCGGLSLWNGERQRMPLPRKAAALLAYLIVEPGPHTRTHLATLLWADSDETHAAMSLRQALSKLREVCGDALQADRMTVVIRREPLNDLCHCDVLRFLQGIDTDAAAACAIDVHLFLNEVTADDAPEFQHWGDRTRARLVRLAVTALARAVQDALAQRNFAVALSAAERWLEMAPRSVDAACHAIDAAVLQHDDQRALLLGEQVLRRLAEEGNDARADVARVQGALQRARTVRWDTPARGSAAVRGPAPRVSAGGSLIPFSLGLCERDKPWSMLRSAFDEVQRDGRAVLLSLAGGVGAGRTRMLQDVSAMCAMQGGVVLATAAPAHAPVIPFGAVASLVAQMADQPALGGLHEGHLQTLRTFAPSLDERFPALRRSVVPISSTDATFTIRLHEALTQAIQVIAEDATIVLALDDAMWYDRESATVLQVVANRTVDHAVMWLLTGADDPGQERANPAWAEFSRGGRTVNLPPLSIEGIEQMLVEFSGIASGWRRLAECVHHGSHGVPGYVLAALQRLQEQWGRVTADWQLRAMPMACLAPLAPRLQQHVESLDDVSRTLLLSLAMVMEHGHPVPLARWHERPALTLEQLSHIHGISRLRAGVLGQRLVDMGLAIEAGGGFRCASPVLVEHLLSTGSGLIRDELRRILASLPESAVESSALAVATWASRVT